MARVKVHEKKRDREVKFQAWLDPQNDQHKLAIDLINAYKEDNYREAEILAKMAQALNQSGDISVEMPQNSSWLETGIKTIMSGISTLQDMIASGKFTLNADHSDQARIHQINTDMDQMQESIAARYHSYSYDPSEDNQEDDF